MTTCQTTKCEITFSKIKNEMTPKNPLDSS